MSTAAPPTGDLTLDRPGDGSLVIRLAGAWRLEAGLPSTELVERELDSDVPKRIGFDTEGLGRWDSGILTFLVAVSRLGRERDVDVDLSGLPEGLQRLVALAEAVPEKDDARGEETERQFVELLGEKALETHYLIWSDVEFLG